MVKKDKFFRVWFHEDGPGMGERTHELYKNKNLEEVKKRVKESSLFKAGWVPDMERIVDVTNEIERKNKKREKKVGGF